VSFTHCRTPDKIIEPPIIIRRIANTLELKIMLLKTNQPKPRPRRNPPKPIAGFSANYSPIRCEKTLPVQK
jgi:hypothetical protein